MDKLTSAQQDEVHRVCDIIPDVEVKVDIFVEDEGEIAENDLVTIKVFFLPISFLMPFIVFVLLAPVPSYEY